MVLQAISLDELSSAHIKNTIPLVRQMTLEKYEELLTLNERTKGASWFLTALEFLGLFASSKAITQMWSLILVIQFVAYMSTW